MLQISHNLLRESREIDENLVFVLLPSKCVFKEPPGWNRFTGLGRLVCIARTKRSRKDIKGHDNGAFACLSWNLKLRL